MTFTPAATINSSGAFSGGSGSAQRLTVTNTGGGVGLYIALSDQEWTSNTGKVSAELQFVSNSGSIDMNQGFQQLGMGSPCGVYITSAGGGELRDITTGLTLESITIDPDYVCGAQLDQAAGTATYADSNGNTGALAVDAGYNNANPTKLLGSINTSSGGSGVADWNTGNVAWQLPQSEGRHCDY